MYGDAVSDHIEFFINSKFLKELSLFLISNEELPKPIKIIMTETPKSVIIKYA